MAVRRAIVHERRQWTTATSIAGGIGVVALAVPLVASLWPSERVRALGGSVLAGRLFKDVPAPTNLEVPPYRFAFETTLRIGVDPDA